MGVRFQLDPAFNVNAHTNDPHARTVLRALQKYGMYLRDSGGYGNRGDLGVSALSRVRHPERYAGITGLDGFHAFNIPWEHMRILEHGPENPARQGGGGVLDNTQGCAVMLSSSGVVQN